MRKKLTSLMVLIVMFFSFVTACSSSSTVDDKSKNKTNQITSENKNTNGNSQDSDKCEKENQQTKQNQKSKQQKSKKDKQKRDNKSKDDIKEKESSESIDENGKYTSKDEVALYIYKYGKLPSNYITKNEAKKLGWDSKQGNLWEITDKMSIGGDRFSNREGKLPNSDSRKWFECDIDYGGGHRGAKRIVYSNDGLIYYTDDHYETFTLLYEGE